MNSKRRLLLAALVASSTAAPANAGCLDWLFCKQPAPVGPYAVGYAPQPTVTPLGPPVLTGTTVAPYTAGYTPYTAGYAPFAGGNAMYAAAYAGLQPNVAGQAPAYPLPIDNPSVLTGRPVMQTSYFGSTALPPAAMPPAALPPAALPPAAFVPQAQPQTSFFGQVLGNQYQTSYYNVPTTSYRPVTQVDPATGATVIVQQPCTSLTQQVQRSPYTSLQPAPAPVSPHYGEPTCGSEPPRYASPTGSASMGTVPLGYAPPTGYPTQGGVSQATAIAPTYGVPGSASQILSSNGFGQQPYGGLPAPLSQPNTQPLIGYPNGSLNGPNGDSAPLSQPQLDAYRPSWTPSPPAAPSYAPNTSPSLPPSAIPSNSFPSTSFPSTSYPSTSSTLEAPPLPSSSWPERREVRANDSFTGMPSLNDPSTRDKYSDIAPIPAPQDYRAPSWGEAYPKPNATTVDSGRDRWNESSPSALTLSEPRTASNERAGSDVNLRYASTPNSLAEPMPIPRNVAPPQEPRRDDSGWFVVEPR